MEIKDGRITPTSKREARVYSRLLREQEVANQWAADGAAFAETGQPLSGTDSYKLFCAIERAVNAPESRPKKTSQEEAAILGKTIVGLTMAHLERLQLESLQNEATALFLGNSDENRRAHIIYLASQALETRYDN